MRRVDDYLVDRVLLAVEQIPRGRVAGYGDLARIAGTSPRRVGSIMRQFGGDVPWWRVVGASGDPGGRLLPRFLPHWETEGITVKPNGLGCRMADYRADQARLERDYRRALSSTLDAHGTPLPAIGVPATRALASIGVTVLEQVIEHSEGELLALQGVGPTSIRMLSEALDTLGWTWTARNPGR